MPDAGARRQLAWLIGLLVVFSAATLLVLPRRGESRDPRASTLLTTRAGTAGLYGTMEELGLPVARRYTPFVQADPLRGTLVMLATGTVGLSPSERSALIAWVRTGGTLIIVPGAASLFERLAPALELGQHVPVLPGGFVEQPRFPVRIARHRWTEGADSVAPTASAFRALPDDLVHDPLLATDAGAPVALVYRFGEGTVLALADQTLVSNRTAEEAPGAVQILVRGAAALVEPGDTIWFDEYHHGFSGGGGPVRALLGYARSAAPGRALLQLGAVALGLLLLLGRRFGRPRAPRPPRRRSPLEHVDALARVYAAANARRTARDLLVAGLARRLREPQAGRDGDADALLARLEAHPDRGAPARRLAAALAGDAPPLAIAAAIDDVIDPKRPLAS